MNPQTIEKLEPITAPLQGINLIEASAGTGKTYTITTLFIRLILEQHLPVDNILVVTFTEAATEELRDRVRRRLREALIAFQQRTSEDEVLAQLMAKCDDHNAAIFRLTNALRGFDEAAIFTIHSFCRQMLQDNAFESGVLFDSELVNDQSYLLREIVEDFWRQHFYQTSQLFITYALENDFDKPTSLLKTLKYGQYVGQPFLKIIPQLEAPSLTAGELAFYTAFSETQQAWLSHAAAVEDLLLNDKNLNRNKYRKTSIPQWHKALDSFLSNTQKMSITLPEKFIKFTSNELAKSVKKNKAPPQHEFFALCDKLFAHQQALSDSFRQHLLALKTKLFAIAEPALTQKKQQQHIQSFDDLLINLHKALKGMNGQSLAQLIRKKYHAALIDEFQDTDPVQYEIFRTIYGDGNRILFLIGDPKQAIYSFRGADIFTYMAACHDASHRYTLATNWRSEPDLIAGANKLFGKTEHPFIFKDIPFQPVQAPSRDEGKSGKVAKGGFSHLKIENKFLPPLQLWFVRREIAGCAANKSITKVWAKQKIPLSIGNEIARLLMLGQQEQALIGNRPLVAGDIAVLVRTNTQARQMQKVLTKLQIPSVLYSRESLFASFEMMEIERVLRAVAEPSNEPLIKAALTTNMFGISGNELHKLMENDLVWQQRLNRFQHYHFLWQRLGFIQMYRRLLLQEQVQTRLLIYPDGERRLTNVLHAAEVLQQAAMQQKLGISELCQWLSQQRYQQEAQEAATSEQQLRLESDEKLIKIVTVHKSKGLEYPIVFCPFVWDGYLHNSKAEQFTFHNDSDELTLDLGSATQEQHREAALEEERAENLRLFYVAVTRAKHRCYLVWGAFKDASTSALAHLLHPGVEVEKADDAILWQGLQSLVSNHIQVSPLPIDDTPYQRPAEKIVKLQPRRFAGKIDKGWKVSSFTSLFAKTSSTEIADQPDYDETTLVRPFISQDELPADKDHIFSFPRGARAGTFMHALFENMDFTKAWTQNKSTFCFGNGAERISRNNSKPGNYKSTFCFGNGAERISRNNSKADVEAIVTKQLRNSGYDVEQWQTVIMKLVADVLNTPLESQGKTFTLSQISRDKRLNELEFYYPVVSSITQQGLQAILGKSEQPVSPTLSYKSNRLRFSPVRGFMKGYIDMVFEYEGRYYLIDYKSNMLGTQPQAYHHSNLKVIMEREGYVWQYHIYAIALHFYLVSRLPNYRYEEHFGGVYYLFLRGMNPTTGTDFGVYRDLPKPELINELAAYFQN